MNIIIPRLSTLATASVIAAFSFLPVHASAEGQRSGRRGGQSSGGGGAQPRSGGGERTGTAAPRSDGGATTGTATGRTGSTPTAAATADGDGTNTGQGTATGRRSSEGQPDGKAVRRRDEGRPGGGTTVIVPGGYYGGYLPWGYAGLGLAGYYGGGYYDGYGYGYPQYSASSGEEGSLRLKVKPRDASVFVDGYFAGHVDDFDGVFQRLHIEPGPHRIEISADGYETLTFEIRAESDRKTTYTGTLNRVQ
jgi:PEGA domain